MSLEELVSINFPEWWKWFGVTKVWVTFWLHFHVNFGRSVLGELGYDLDIQIVFFFFSLVSSWKTSVGRRWCDAVKYANFGPWWIFFFSLFQLDWSIWLVDFFELDDFQLRDCFGNGSWNYNLLQFHLSADVLCFLLGFSFTFTQEPDVIVWRPQLSGLFTLSLAFSLVRDKQQCRPWLH